LKEPSRSIKKTAVRHLKGIGEIFELAPNSHYKADDLARTLVETSLTNGSAEQCLSPSPDTVLRRLHRTDEEAFSQVVWRSNAHLLKKLRLPRMVTIAIDYTTLPYYGIEQPSLVSCSDLPGTTFGVRFAMLSVVEAGRTFTLRARQVGPFASKSKVLLEMLDAAKKLIKPKLVLLDRAFFTVDVIKALKSNKTHFLMPAKRTAPIKRLCRAFGRKEVPPVVDYVVKTAGDSVHVKLIFVRRKTKEGMKTYVFVSDIGFEPDVASELYRRRWRIETNNREVEKFRARTTSRSMKIRRMYYVLAALLYNIWIVMRNVVGNVTSCRFKRTLEIMLSALLPATLCNDTGPSL